jgi:hypothetical protein
MLSTLLSQTGTVLSKLFVFSSFVPTLMFTFLNGALLFLWQAPFRAWVLPKLQGAEPVFDLTVAIVGLATIAYILFTLNNWLRVILETAAFLPQFVRAKLSASEEGRLRWLRERYLHARDERRDIQRLREQDRRLVTALNLGSKLTAYSYDAKNSDAAKKLFALELCVARNAVVASGDADCAIELFKAELSGSNKDLTHNSALDDHHVRLMSVMDNAVARWKFEETEFFNRSQFEFGGLTPKPTRLGNVAGSVQNYALSRYNLNLDALWTRFLCVMRLNKDAYAAIDDAKTQLDFLVACTWLSGMSTVIWTIVLALTGHSVGAFLCMALGGPVLSYVFYDFAVRSYMVLADIMRTAIDQYRFTILESMALPVPSGLREERQIWQAVNTLVVQGGEYLEVSYRPKGKESTA